MAALEVVLAVGIHVLPGMGGPTGLLEKLKLGQTLDSLLAAADRALSLPTSLSSQRISSLQELVDLELRTRWMQEAAAGAE